MLAFGLIWFWAILLRDYSRILSSKLSEGVVEVESDFSVWQLSNLIINYIRKVAHHFKQDLNLLRQVVVLTTFILFCVYLSLLYFLLPGLVEI